jgi:hypothetical protein
MCDGGAGDLARGSHDLAGADLTASADLSLADLAGEAPDLSGSSPMDLAGADLSLLDLAANPADLAHRDLSAAPADLAHGRDLAMPPPDMSMPHIVWTRSSSGLAADDITQIISDPNSGNILYAATAAGVFKTTSAEAATPSWSLEASGLTDTSIDALAIDPADSMSLYAATRNGIFHSANGGTSWALFGNASPTARALAVGPSSTGGRAVYAGGGGVQVTTDGGGIWTPGNGPGTHYLQSLAVDPLHPGTVYAGFFTGGGAACSAANPCMNSQVCDATSHTCIFPGVYQSTDYGLNWTPYPSSLPQMAGPSVISLVVAPTTVYAGTDSFTGRVYQSINGGAWTVVNNGVTNGFRALVGDSRATTTLYAGGFGVFTTQSTGTMWTPVGPPTLPLVNTLAMDPTAPTTVYVGGATQGVYRQTASAGSFINNGLDDATVQSMVVDPTNVNRVYAALGRSGVYVSTNAGVSWGPINTGLTNAGGAQIDIEELAIDSAGTLYAGSQLSQLSGSGVFSRSSSATTFTPLTGGTNPTAIHSLIVDPAHAGQIYVGTTVPFPPPTVSAVYLWNGTQWTGLANTGLPAPPSFTDPFQTPGLALTSSGALYASYSSPLDGGGVYLYTGSAWTSQNGNLPSGATTGSLAVSALAITPGNANIVYAGAAAAGVYKTITGGL